MEFEQVNSINSQFSDSPNRKLKSLFLYGADALNLSFSLWCNCNMKRETFNKFNNGTYIDHFSVKSGAPNDPILVLEKYKGISKNLEHLNFI